MRREDVSIEVLGNVLTLRGSRPPGRAGVAAESYLRMEVASGTFERAFALPCPVAAERVEAVLRDGVLVVPGGAWSHMTQRAVWETPATEVVLLLAGADFEADLSVTYTGRALKAERGRSQRAKQLEEF